MSMSGLQARSLSRWPAMPLRGLLAVAAAFGVTTSHAALNANQSQVSGLVSSICAEVRRPPNTDLPPVTPDQFQAAALDVCRQGETAVRAITPDQILSIGSLATRVNGGQISLINQSISSRLTELRKKKGKEGGGAGDEDFSRLGFWFKTQYDFGTRETTSDFTGFKFDNFGFTAGGDYRITDDWVAGAAFTYRRTNANLDSARGDTDSDAYSGSIYTSYYVWEGLHLDATGSYGGLNYDTVRNIVFPGFSSIAKGAPGAEQYSFSGGLGYDFQYQAFTLAPYARTDYIGLDVDGFTETGGGAWDVRFDEQHIRSLTSTVGAQTSYAFSFPWGVLTPQLRGEWHHQFLDGQRIIQAGFVADPAGRTFNLINDATDRDFYTFGAEVSGVFAHGLSAFVAYENLLGVRHIDSHKVMLGGRMEF